MRDLEWLKEQVNDYLDIEGVEDARMALKAVLGYIDQLDEPETLSQEWIDNHTAGADTIAHYSEEDVLVVTVSDLEKLLVPKVDLPEIPDYVADFIKENKKTANHWFEAFDEVVDYYNGALLADEKTKAYHYIIRNIDRYVDAYRYGYTVGEKKYYILLPKINRNWLYISLRSNYDEFIDHYTDSVEDLQIFTEKEIKAVEPRYFAFAVPAEELEE